jgi:mannonate dehydratase
MSGLSRRRLLASGPAALLTAGCSTLFGHERARRPPVGVRGFVRRAFDGLARERVWDSHAHIIGLGTGDSGCWVNEAYRTELYKSFLFDIYMTAGGVKDLSDADREYIERLMRLVHLMNPQGRIVLMGFDYRIDERGEIDLEHSEIHTPNDYVYRLAERFEQIAPAPSIHPYREDALDRLDEAKAKGAVAIKWLPNSQGIDPALPRVDAYYDKLVEHGLVLITHGGEEQAVDSEESQSFGNVLKLRRPLDRGVRVVIAHCAGLGFGDDLDAPEGERRALESFDLFLRLMGERQYEDNLFADISAMTQFNRSGRPLREIVLAEELHPRLVNGSDYPLPAINPLYSTRWLERAGYLTRRERERCNAVYRANPLLFDFVVKRTLRVTDETGRERRLSDSVFETAWVFEGHTPKTRPMPT